MTQWLYLPNSISQTLPINQIVLQWNARVHLCESTFWIGENYGNACDFAILFIIVEGGSSWWYIWVNNELTIMNLESYNEFLLHFQDIPLCFRINNSSSRRKPWSWGIKWWASDPMRITGEKTSDYRIQVNHPISLHLFW